MEKRLTIRSAVTPAERDQALSFISRMAWKSYQCAPPPPPEVVLAAYVEGAIVGTMSLDLGVLERPLPAEEIWRFDRKGTPLPFESTQLVQYGRWMADYPSVSTFLVYAATLYAQMQKRETIVCEIKPPARDLLRKIGINLHLVGEAQLMFDKIPREGLAYYTDEPPPELCMVEVAKVEAACRKRVPEIQGLELAFAIS